jgi:hypothetical protein
VREFVKKLVLPDGFDAPPRLTHGDVVATVLGREDLDDDVRAINASLELIRRTRGGDWPKEPVTPELNYVDLVWHECEFREGFSFSYAIRHSEGTTSGAPTSIPWAVAPSSTKPSSATTSTSAGG